MKTPIQPVVYDSLTVSSNEATFLLDFPVDSASESQGNISTLLYAVILLVGSAF